MHPSAPVPVVSYEVLFPPGPHGLELEPVVRSADRAVGCRVRGFYFGVDHEGVDREYLEAAVEEGDIICSVDGVNTLSLGFEQILALLRAARDRERVVVFKNVSASCESSLPADSLTEAQGERVPGAPSPRPRPGRLPVLRLLSDPPSRPPLSEASRGSWSRWSSLLLPPSCGPPWTVSGADCSAWAARWPLWWAGWRPQWGRRWPSRRRD